MEHRKVTKGQISSIVALLASDKVTYEQAQAFIDTYKNVPSPKHRRRLPAQPEPRTEPSAANVAPSIDEQRVAHWDKKFPGRGAAIMDVFRPFYDWNPELKPPVHDLEDRVKRLGEWIDVQGVELMRDPNDDSGTMICNVCDRMGRKHDSKAMWSSFVAAGFAAEKHQARDFVVECIKEMNDPVQVFNASNKYFGSSWDNPWIEFSVALDLAFVYAVLGDVEMTQRFKEYLRFWLDGNYPICLAPQGRMVIFVAG